MRYFGPPISAVATVDTSTSSTTTTTTDTTDCRQQPGRTMALTPDASPKSLSRPRTPMSLDLSSLPPLSFPTPPSNTLLITNLQDAAVFRPDNLQTIKNLIHASAPIHTWAPLKSFRRIMVSFYDDDSAIRIRNILDGEAIMGEAVKVYFGQRTNIEARPEHLNLPDAGKLFFISPPPSPPQGWEVKMEDAPNKMVHAEDLAEALAKLHHRPRASGMEEADPAQYDAIKRQRSGSTTTIYDPAEHGNSPGLPAISVVDLTGQVSPLEGAERPILAHTARPPVELRD